MENFQSKLITKMDEQNQKLESYIESNNAQFSRVMGTVEKLLSLVLLNITHDKNDPAVLRQLTKFTNINSPVSETPTKITNILTEFTIVLGNQGRWPGISVLVHSGFVHSS